MALIAKWHTRVNKSHDNPIAPTQNIMRRSVNNTEEFVRI